MANDTEIPVTAPLEAKSLYPAQQSMHFALAAPDVAIGPAASATEGATKGSRARATSAAYAPMFPSFRFLPHLDTVGRLVALVRRPG